MFLTGCRASSEKQQSQLAPTNLPLVKHITTALEDKTEEMPGGDISWSTYWKLSWDAYPGAEAYELKVITMEGSSPRLRRQAGTSYRLQIAAGRNPKAQGLLNRKKLIDLQMGQLSYQVRAVLPDHQYSAWSVVIPVRE